MPIGAGLVPAGFSLAGFGVVDVPPVPNFLPLPDPVTGLSDTGRLINQTTKDYVFAPDGRLQGMPTVNQLVLLAIQNNVDPSKIQEKGQNFKQLIATMIQNALADLISSKLVLLVSVTVTEPNPDAGLGIANWLDLTTGNPQQTQF